MKVLVAASLAAFGTSTLISMSAVQAKVYFDQYGRPTGRSGAEAHALGAEMKHPIWSLKHPRRAGFMIRHPQFAPGMSGVVGYPDHHWY